MPQTAALPDTSPILNEWQCLHTKRHSFARSDASSDDIIQRRRRRLKDAAKAKKSLRKEISLELSPAPSPSKQPQITNKEHIGAQSTKPSSLSPREREKKKKINSFVEKYTGPVKEEDVEEHDFERGNRVYDLQQAAIDRQALLDKAIASREDAVRMMHEVHTDLEQQKLEPYKAQKVTEVSRRPRPNTPPARKPAEAQLGAEVADALEKFESYDRKVDVVEERVRLVNRERNSVKEQRKEMQSQRRKTLTSLISNMKEYNLDTSVAEAALAALGGPSSDGFEGPFQSPSPLSPQSSLENLSAASEDESFEPRQPLSPTTLSLQTPVSPPLCPLNSALPGSMSSFASNKEEYQSQTNPDVLASVTKMADFFSSASKPPLNLLPKVRDRSSSMPSIYAAEPTSATTQYHSNVSIPGTEESVDDVIKSIPLEKIRSFGVMVDLEEEPATYKDEAARIEDLEDQCRRAEEKLQGSQGSDPIE